MTLSRWRRVATGVAAGVIVLCAALLGGSFRADSDGVAVAADNRPATVIPIPEDNDPVDEVAAAPDTTDEATVEDEELLIEPFPDEASAVEDGATEASTVEEAAVEEAAVEESAAEDGAVQVIDPQDLPESDAAQPEAVEPEAAPAEAADPAPAEEVAAPEEAEPAAEPAAPITAADDALGTGGGVDDAECGLDRLVIYAGARVGGVAGSIRNALNQAGFAAGCPAPVAVLASNCPLQFSGVLGANSGYSPNQSFVAASDAVDRETMTAVMGSIGFSGNEINILDFGFTTADKPGEQWMAIFIPPSFDGWQDLANRAGLAPTSSSLCAPSGELAG